MLEDLSQHVLDIAENSVSANATEVLVELVEDVMDDELAMIVEDNGKGMEPDFLARVTDPFTTTRTTRRVGMGLPFLKQSAELCEGRFVLTSTVNVGTRTEAHFRYCNIDRPPVGDIASTMMALFMGHPEIDWTYRHRVNANEFSLTTLEIIEAIEDRELLRSTEIGLWIRDMINENLDELRAPE